MALLQPRMQAGKLVLSAETKVNGAVCRLALCFEAALQDTHAYSLRIEIAWDGQSESAREYHQKAAPAWFDLWLRHYTPAQPPAPGAGSRERYEAIVQETLAAESHLIDVPAVQREVLEGLRRGGSYATSHKEGGTRIHFRGGRFVRADYGESDTREAYADEEAFLAFLRRFYDWQTSRGTYPEKVDELTAWKLILRLQDPPDGPGASQPGGRGGSRTLRAPRGSGGASRLAMLAAGIVLAGTAAWGFLSDAVAVRTTGTPLAPAVASADHVALLIATQERDVPSLQRDPGKDRFRIALLVQPRSGEGARRLISVRDQLDASQSQHAARMLGFDGRIFWFLARDIAGYDPAADRLVRNDTGAVTQHSLWIPN